MRSLQKCALWLLLYCNHTSSYMLNPYESREHFILEHFIREHFIREHFICASREHFIREHFICISPCTTKNTNLHTHTHIVKHAHTSIPSKQLLPHSHTQALAAAKRAAIGARASATAPANNASSAAGTAGANALPPQQHQQTPQPQTAQQQQALVSRSRQVVHQLAQLNGQLVTALRAVVASLLSCRTG